MDPMVVPTVDGSQIPKVSKHIPRSTFDATTPLKFDKTAPQHSHTLPETNMAPENRPFAPKGKDRIPTIHFHVRAVSFREGS